MLPAGDVEGDVVERDDAAKAHADVLHAQQRRPFAIRFDRLPPQEVLLIHAAKCTM